MPYSTESMKRIQQKVYYYLQRLFGERAFEITPERTFRIRKGSCVVDVEVRPWQGNDALVVFSACVVKGADVSEELMRKLLELNGQKLQFGAFGLDQNGDVVLTHSAIGTTLDKDELRYAIWSMAVLADGYDDIIKERFGGKTMAECMGAAEEDCGCWEDHFDYEFVL